jgi:predicted metalloenzyme YecM
MSTKSEAIKNIDFFLLVKAGEALSEFLGQEIQTSRIKKPVLILNILQKVLEVPEEREGELPQEVFDAVANVQQAVEANSISEAINKVNELSAAELAAAAEKAANKPPKESKPRPPKEPRIKEPSQLSILSDIIAAKYQNLETKEVIEEINKEVAALKLAVKSTTIYAEYNNIRRAVRSFRKLGIMS